MAVAALNDAPPRLQSEVAVAGYSYEGALGAPTLTFGKVADIRGLNGETGVTRLNLAAQPGDAGGPVFDDHGNVVGMLLPTRAEGRTLPRDVSLAAAADHLHDLLSKAGATAQTAQETGQVSPDELNRRAIGMTVLVNCWD